MSTARTLDKAIKCMDLQSSGWTKAYSEFQKIIDKFFPDADKISQEAKKLYQKHKGDPGWDEAWTRWNRQK